MARVIAFGQLAHLEPALGQGAQEIVVVHSRGVFVVQGVIQLRRTVEGVGEPGFGEECGLWVTLFRHL